MAHLKGNTAMREMNYELKKKVYPMPEFKEYRVVKSDSYSVTLEKTVKDKTETVVVYASYSI